MERESTQKVKFKGILKNSTFLKLLYHSGDFFNGDYEVLKDKPVYLPDFGGVLYATKKARFLARRKNVKYWNIWQFIGEN